MDCGTASRSQYRHKHCGEKKKTGENSLLSQCVLIALIKMACVPFGVCECMQRAVKCGSGLRVWRVVSRALDHAVKWKVLVHNHKPSRQ